MARKIVPITRFAGGLSYSDKEGAQSSYLWGKSVDYRTDPRKLKILPKSKLESGTVVVDLPLWADRYSTDAYFYGNAGHIYKRTSAVSWSDLRTVSDSHGNGMKYFGEDGFLYYASDKTLGRYGHMSGTPSFVDDYLFGEGGAPTNTHSLLLVAASSHHADAPDHASLSITGDMTLEANIKFASLPAVGEMQTFISKWDLNSDERSYIFGLYGVSGYFGDGGDGALTISADTTQAPTDSACTGTADSYSLSATNVSFATGQKVLIHQTQGTNAGQWERREIASYTAGTITLTEKLSNTYTTGAQVIVLLEYTNVTVNSGKTWTAKAWNGTVGGILAFLANGTVTVTGTITATGKGFVGGNGYSTGSISGGAYCGEGTVGVSSVSNSANGNGGGGATYVPAQHGDAGGGGGGNGNAGSAGNDAYANGGDVGSQVGTASLTNANLGGGGGGGYSNNSRTAGNGGTGGGLIFITGTTTTVSGSIFANGNNGGNAGGLGAGGGGGAGGSVLIKGQVVTLGSGLITATKGTGGTSSDSPSAAGGNGSDGRIHLDYYTSYTGTTSPTLDYAQDNSLLSTTSYQLRFGVSSNGTAEEYLTKTITDPTTGQWYHYAVSWDASGSLATFYRNGSNLGTSTGALTACYNSTALLDIGASKNDATVQNKLNGNIDDIRIWNDIRTDAEISANRQVELVGSEAGLAAYYQLDNAATDSTANANNLTLRNSAAYDAADVPFSAATTRRDLDQSLDTSGQTYTLTAAINEGATHRQTFVPAKDPQKSIQVLVAAAGTGDWVITVHDALNRTVATATIAVANVIAATDLEFTFTTAWTPIIGASYHFHLTQSTADGTVTTTTTTDLETVDFHTYYQFLIDSNYHPIEQVINKLAIGNGRYLATWDGITYNPHTLTLPSGYNIRCLGTWREYLVIGTYLGSNIYDYDYSRLFFWNGIDTTYNFYIDVPYGAVNAIQSGDPMYLVAGYSGDLLRYSDGLSHIQRLPNINDTDIVEVFPKALTMWKSLTRIGMAGGDSSASDLERGVYSYGRINNRVENTLSFDYPVSLGTTTGNGLQIGLLYPLGSMMMMSWKSGSSYGVDRVGNSSDGLFASASYEGLITDADKLWADKGVNYIRAYFKPIVSGDTYRIKYRIDREDDWTYGDVISAADTKEARLAIPSMGTRWNDLQYGVNITTTNTTSPEFYGIAAEIDDFNEEKRV